MNRDETNGYLKCIIDEALALEAKIARVSNEGDVSDRASEHFAETRANLQALISSLSLVRGWNVSEKK